MADVADAALGPGHAEQRPARATPRRRRCDSRGDSTPLVRLSRRGHHAEFKAWIGCIFTTTLAQGGFDCQVDCDAVIGTPSRPSTLPPTMPTRPPTDNDSDGALGLTTTLAAAVAVAAAL